MRPDVIVVVRWSEPGMLYYLAEAREAGQRVVIDWDDALWAVPPTNRAAKVARRDSPISYQWVLQACELADVVTCSTEHLARALDRQARKEGVQLPEVCVLENCVDLSMWEVSGEPDAVGWTGHAQYRDVEIHMMPDLAQIARRRGWRAIHVGYGTVPGWRRVPGYPVDQWHYSARHYGVGVAPLARSSFSDCKSHIKVLEYAAAGKPCVASDSPAYEAWRGVVPLCSTADEWRDTLAQVLDDDDYRAEIARRAWEHAQKWDIRDRWREYWEAWTC
jgi:hypothetical protein